MAAFRWSWPIRKFLNLSLSAVYVSSWARKWQLFYRNTTLIAEGWISCDYVRIQTIWNYSAQSICIVEQCRPLAGLLRLDEALVNSFWLKSKQNYVKLDNIDRLFYSPLNASRVYSGLCWLEDHNIVRVVEAKIYQTVSRFLHFESSIGHHTMSSTVNSVIIYQWTNCELEATATVRIIAKSTVLGKRRGNF